MWEFIIPSFKITTTVILMFGIVVSHDHLTAKIISEICSSSSHELPDSSQPHIRKSEIGLSMVSNMYNSNPTENRVQALWAM